MGITETITGKLAGSQIVEVYLGRYTGDRKVVTADGRVWSEIRGIVPNSMPTGSVIATVQK